MGCGIAFLSVGLMGVEVRGRGAGRERGGLMARLYHVHKMRLYIL